MCIYGFASGAGVGYAQSVEKKYIVVFKDEAKLPSGYEDLLKKLAARFKTGWKN